jgi:hypothetical protein
MERYGVEYTMQSEEMRGKARSTSHEHFGVEYPAQSPDVRAKFQQTCRERYGVDHYMHDPDIAEKVLHAAFRHRDYITPSGKLLRLQGYEPYAYQILLDEGLTEENILYRRGDMPEIWYEHDGKIRRYYPDFYLPEKKLIVEVKSDYTYFLHLERNQAKENATRTLGYDYRLMIFNQRLELV